MDSEADLFTAIASFTFLSSHPDLYPVFVGSGAFTALVKLFAHENIDIAISVLEVLVELTGEDVEIEKESDMQVLIDGIFKDGGIEVMIGNLERLDEAKDDDRQGVFHTLSNISFIFTYNSRVGKHHILFTILCKSSTRLPNIMAPLPNRKQRTSNLPK
jgi:beta-catenin-like protein 1